jgi:hypothetical protein
VSVALREPERYQRRLRSELGELVDELELSEIERRALRARFLDRVLWAEKRATDARRAYYAVRMTAILGGVLVPALVSLNIGDTGAEVIRWVTFGVSLIVAMAIATEEFFHFGDRWRHYRRVAEWLKQEGWEFLQLTSEYRNRTHAQAFPLFARKIERLVHEDVEKFVSEIVYDKRDQGVRRPTDTPSQPEPTP